MANRLAEHAACSIDSIPFRRSRHFDMRGFLVNASVAVKWPVDEPLSEAAAKLLDDGLLLVAPEPTYVEVANALWAMTRRGNIAPTDVREALDLLDGVQELRLMQLLPVMFVTPASLCTNARAGQRLK